MRGRSAPQRRPVGITTITRSCIDNWLLGGIRRMGRWEGVCHCTGIGSLLDSSIRSESVEGRGVIVQREAELALVRGR